MGTLILSIVTLLMLSGCGSTLPSTYGNSKNFEKPGTETRLQGIVQLEDGSTIDISTEPQPLILIFATRFCQVCQIEAKKMSQFFVNGPPTNVKIVTVMAGANMDFAVRWKQRMGVNWLMGADAENEIFHPLCPEHLTPCVYTIKNGRGMRHIGETSFEQLQSETEMWQFAGGVQ